MTQPDDHVLLGEVPSEEEVFYCKLGDQLLKDTLPFLNQVLRQLVALAAALFAAAVLIFDRKIVHPPSMVVAMVFLLASLSVALSGLLPYGISVPRWAPYAIADGVRRLTRFKTFAAWAAGIALLLALLVVGVGLWVNHL